MRQELYHIVVAGTDYRVTSGDYSVVALAETWTPDAIYRGGVEAHGDMSRQALELRCEAGSTVGAAIRATDGVTTFTVYTFNGSTASVIWKGRLAGYTLEENELVLNGENIFTSLKRPGLRARYQRNCRHALYSADGCRVARASFAQAVTISSVVTTTVVVSTVGGNPDNYFAGGELLAADGTRRMIITQVGTTLTLWTPILSLAAAQSATIYPGCDRSLTTCTSKFSNAANFGGFPWIPQQNPFGETGIR